MSKLLKISINLYYVFFIYTSAVYGSNNNICNVEDEDSSSAFGNYGATWSQTLNFYDENSGIKTGPYGNVIKYDIKNEKLDEKNYDIHLIHTVLHNDAEKIRKIYPDKNIVFVNFTCIVKVGDSFIAYDTPLKEGELKIAFVNGSNDKNDKLSDIIICEGGIKFRSISASSLGYNATDLSEAFNNRIKEECNIKGRKQVIECCNSWQRRQKAFYQNFNDLKDSLSLEKLMDELSATHTNMQNNFGSTIDSEQFLIKHLTIKSTSREGTKQEQNSASGIKEEEKSALTNHFGGLAEKSKNQHKVWLKEKVWTYFDSDDNSIGKISNLYQHKNKFEVSAYIMHVYSTRQICSCCAYSITKELLLTDIPTQIKNLQHTSRNALFILLASCGIEELSEGSESNNNIEATNSIPPAYKRTGIGSNNKLSSNMYLTESNEDDPVVNVSKVVGLGQNKLFLQKNLNVQTIQSKKQKKSKKLKRAPIDTTATGLEGSIQQK